jgi:diguanylate cyclase (GGDEF)-like protein
MPEFTTLGARLAAAPGTDAAAQLRLRHMDGSYRWFGVVGVDLRANPSVRGIVYNARDITEQHELQEELRRQATHDGLTGLANRALLNERLAGTRGELSVLVIDLDGFKQVNDVYGHHAGDELLVTVADRLTAAIGPGDLAARLGGDEFAVLLAGAGAQRAEQVAEAIALALGQPMRLSEGVLQVGASVGAATGVAGEVERLLRDADAAMYRKKQARRAPNAAS